MVILVNANIMSNTFTVKINGTKDIRKSKNQTFRKYKRWDCIEQRREENKNMKVYITEIKRRKITQ